MANSVQHQHCFSGIRLRAANGTMALAAMLVLGVVAAQSAQAQTFTVLHNFIQSPSDGEFPYAGLIRDTAGNLYGTTEDGGSSNHGTVFKINASGTETVLYNFAGGTDGKYPFAELIRDAAGNFYGTTAYGGDLACNAPEGCGTVFMINSAGHDTVLHSFAGGSSDGCNPYGGLIRDKAGYLYGTAIACGAYGYGTVFKINASGTMIVLHSFTSGDGIFPTYTSLLMDKKGNLYGINEQGGSSGYGTVYELSKTGILTVLHSFAGGTTDGCYAYGTPAMDTKGNLYGTTELCGPANLGIVWKVSKNGTETVLHTFAGGPSDGGGPYAGVIMDAKSNLYGTASSGGSGFQGVVYELSSTGTMTVLHSFAGSDGENPAGAGRLIRDAKGDLYGTTVQEISNCCGTVWELTP